MTPADFKPFATALAICAETLDAPMSELRVRGYFEALQDLPLAPLVAAIKAQMQTATFMPKPGELRALVCGTAADAAELAWAQLFVAMRRVGRYGNPRDVLDSAATNAMLATFGTWGNCCDMSTEGPERIGYAKRFMAAYQAGARRTEHDHRALSVADLPKALQGQARALLGIADMGGQS